MQENKTTAVILVNWNSYALTAGCIQSLRAMVYADYDIVVVDNGSGDDSVRLFRSNFPDVILIESAENRGFTGGNNLGMQFACDSGYRYQILLNNDTFVEKDFLEKLVTYMETHPEIGVIQPLIYFDHNRSLVWNGGSFYKNWLGIAHTDNYNRVLQPSSAGVREVDWVTGCAFLTRSAIIRETGMLAPNLFIYYEDVDLSFRIRKAGYKLVYYPASIVYHIAGMSNRSKTPGKEGFVNPVVHYLNVRNRIWLLKKYTRPIYFPTVFLYNFFYILAMMVYFVARLRPEKFMSVLKGVKDGLAGKINYT
jgi:GT2 family glycosyltransferase